MGAIRRWPFQRAPFDVLKRFGLWLAAGLTMLSGYGLTKFHPLGIPHLLPLTAFDRAIPFLPWTIWFYGTASYAALIAFLQAPDRLSSRRLYFAVSAAACACWIVFALVPTTYPRGLYPLPPFPTGDSWWDWLNTATIAQFASLRASDTPSNCLPSQHVALAWSLGLTWRSFLTRRWTRALPIAWAVIVTACTLTTKQHYLWDVPTGFLVGYGAYALVQWGITVDVPPFWARRASVIGVTREADIQAIAALRARVEGHQWRLSDIPWPAGPLSPLDPRMVRLINQVIYIEEIAGLNFKSLAIAARSADLERLYALFADEERRHADGLRKILALHGAEQQPPGLGNTLVLDQFDQIDATLDSDGLLLAMSTPVFETFLDAGTIPFLQAHPSLAGHAFDAFVDRVGADEAAHMAVNWIVTREVARQQGGLDSLWFAINPNITRGATAVPAMGIDIYALAASLGFDFSTLLPPFRRLFWLHQRYPEFATFAPWQFFRLFCVCGGVAALVCHGLNRAGILLLPLWVAYTGVTNRVAWALFGPRLLERRGIPALDAPAPVDRAPDEAIRLAVG